MEQLTQNLKDGAMQLLEVPFPVLNAGSVLVRNHYSLISAGTEGKTVKDARMGYIAKARSRKEEVKKVIQTAKTLGIINTYNMVMNKLESPNALGYSCAGEIIGVADDVKEFKIGDRVACGGAGAVHAEVVAVPVNLCVKVGENTTMHHAAFTTLGAIAMQGLRQADLRLGENCVVIGLGLVGQLTCQLLRASGVKAIGIDIDEHQVELATAVSADLSFNRNREDLEQIIYNATDGFGTDAVIITASSNSTDPVELAGVLCKQKGKVVIVGAVPTGFSRKNYYLKELELRMSCSYGPGRYDLDYEEKGIDYPHAYVRWTENRNMQSFADLLNSKKINLERLITHTFDFSNAPEAYQLIVEKSEPFAGIVLKYDLLKQVRSSVIVESKKAVAGEVNASFIGAGAFAQNMLFPNLKDLVNFIGVTTARPNNARNIADKYNFGVCTANATELLNDENTNTIFIATRHDSHAHYVKQALQYNKNVFTEKPLCMNTGELEEIKNSYHHSKSILMVGFNRRFAPHVQRIKQSLDTNSPVAITMRINAGNIPSTHWVQDVKTGGGRIIGEVCHFVDLCFHLAGSKIKTVSAVAMSAPHHLQDTLAIQLLFENGSIATINYFSNGSKELSKEHLEVFSNGIIYLLEDFKTLYKFGKQQQSFKSSTQDKGHRNELVAFTNAIKKGVVSPIPFEELYHSTLATFKVKESVVLNGAVVSMQ